MRTSRYSYPEELRRSADLVHRTRGYRTSASVSFLEVGDLVEAHHPDFRTAGRSVIPFGPNEGQRAPDELVRVLTAPSLVDPSTVSLRPARATDILIIGAGGAGLAAAITAHDLGASVTITTKLRAGDSNTAMATGMACAVGESDSTELHFRDTLAAGHFAASEELVRAMVSEGPDILYWLEQLGVRLAKDRRGDHRLIGKGGGHSTARTVCSPGGLTGLELVRVLREEVRIRTIPVLEYAPAVELVMGSKGQCSGAVVLRTDTGQLEVISAKITILTTGGAGQLRVGGFATSNHHGATADGLVIAYRAGAGLREIDSVQYHPTGSAWPQATRGWLLTEGIRLSGAHLVNAVGERFVDEKRTRDVVTSAILRECAQGRGIGPTETCFGVWLDTPLLCELEPEFEASPIVHKYRRIGLDPCQEPLLVFPTQHYYNGGLCVDGWGRTHVPQLHAAGEVSGGTHGRNRIGGNSLLEVLVFGRRVARHAAEMVPTIARSPRLHLDHVKCHNGHARSSGETRSPVLFPYPSASTAKRFG